VTLQRGELLAIGVKVNARKGPVEHIERDFLFGHKRSFAFADILRTLPGLIQPFPAMKSGRRGSMMRARSCPELLDLGDARHDLEITPYACGSVNEDYTVATKQADLVFSQRLIMGSYCLPSTVFACR